MLNLQLPESYAGAPQEFWEEQEQELEEDLRMMGWILQGTDHLSHMPPSTIKLGCQGLAGDGP